MGQHTPGFQPDPWTPVDEDDRLGWVAVLSCVVGFVLVLLPWFVF